MRHITKILKEIEQSLRQVDLFVITLKTVLLLAVLTVVLLIFDLPVLLALIPALVYLFSSLFVEGHIDHVKILEKKFGKLREKVITARDYKEKDNAVLESLEEDIISNLKIVQLSRFLDFAKVTTLVIILVIMVSISLYISSKEVRLVNFNELMNVVLRTKRRLIAEEDFLSPCRAHFTRYRSRVCANLNLNDRFGPGKIPNR